MAIAYDTSASFQANAGTTTNQSMTVASTANRYLFVVSGSYVTGITFDGVSLTKLNQNIVTYNGGFSYVPNTSVWGLVNPNTGTKTLAVTVGAGNSEAICAAVYNGVDPTQPEAYATNQTSGNNTTQIVDSIYTVTNNAWVMSFVKQEGSLNSLIAGAGTTLRQWKTTTLTSAAIVDSNAAKTPAGVFSQLTTQLSSSQGWFNSVMYSIKAYIGATFSGPSSGNVNAASTNFTYTPDIAITGTVTITPSGAGSAGMSATNLTYSASSAAQTFTITPLTAGAITLTVTNTAGINNPAALTYTANAVAPSAPTIGTAVPLNASATVAFTDNSNGGATITNHTATSSPGGFTGTSATSPITVTGLSNGTPYTFTVTATNSAGTSSASSASNSVTPYVPATSFTFTGPSSGNVRSASTNFTVTPNSTYNGTITITPSGAGSTGLSPVVLTWALSSAAQTFTITPLDAGAITLTPTNSGSLSNPSNLTYTASAVVPLAPGMGLAEPSLGSARVTITAPTNNGGSTITLYTITSSPGGKTATLTSPGTASVTGLTNGTSYTFTATATNSVGTSAASSASNAVTPSASSTTFTNSGPKFNIEKGVGNLISF